MPFSMSSQLVLLPSQALHFRRHNPLRLRFRCFPKFFPIMRGSGRLCHLRQQLLAKGLRPQTPASPHSFPLLRLSFPAPQLRPPLKFLAPGRTVFWNSHLPLQSLHSQPSCALARSLEILPITAPPIGAQLPFLAQ